MEQLKQQTRERRRAKGRPVIDAELCKGCELCVSACPERVLTMAEATNSQGVHVAQIDPEGVCTACKACALICPDCAIEIYRFETGE
ncbi:MAG TPA: 4Fe-4S dicluster domain-containing protein [Spirochaetia bacterium]|nr:4Fe-4S dicluster domain-containing protein [Spirochaetia bacterium]